MKDYQRLVKNIIGLGIIAAAAILIYVFFIKEGDKAPLIDDTPIHIESIKTIAEISTISYKDEVVVDTVEFYSGEFDMYNPFDWKEHILDRKVKRRLTLIFKGEVKYGLDLSDGNYSVNQNEDTLWIKVPAPEILDIIISPKQTEVFQEKGTWGDGARKQLEGIGKNKLKTNAESMGLDKKSLENAERLFDKLIQTNKKLIIQFE